MHGGTRYNTIAVPWAPAAHDWPARVTLRPESLGLEGGGAEDRSEAGAVLTYGSGELANRLSHSRGVCGCWPLCLQTFRILAVNSKAKRGSRLLGTLHAPLQDRRFCADDATLSDSRRLQPIYRRAFDWPA